MVQHNLNLTLACTVPVSENTRSACAQLGIRVFGDLHANRNPSRVIHECTVHEGASLGTRFMPASTRNTQVARVHAVTRKFVHFSVQALYGISVALITAALVYLLAMIIIMRLTSQFAISK